MDIPRALEKVCELLDLVEQSRQWASTDNERYYSDEGRQLSLRIRALLPVVRKIATAVEPDLQNGFVEQPRRWEWSSVYDALIRLRGLLEHDQELAEILGPRGPAAAADQLHSWVWAAAASLWDDGYHREAVQAAATQVEIHARAKIGRQGLSGADLMMQAWATDPPRREAARRLRFTELQPGTETFISAHEGAKFFGAGCMLGIRNLLTHTLDQPPPQVALEHLAALSVLARWIEAAEVAEVSPP